MGKEEKSARQGADFSSAGIACKGVMHTEERQTGYIGKRKDRKAARRHGGKRLLLFPIALLLFSLFFHLSLSAKLSEMAKLEGAAMIEGYLQKSVLEAMKKDEVSYSSLIRLSFQSDGSVAALETDVLHCNFLCADTLLLLLQRMKETNRLRVGIPLGNLSGLALLSGKGPVCRTEFLFTGKASAYLASEFTKSGINQTRHAIYLVLSAETLLFLPHKEEQLRVETRVPIAETILLGRVPDAYTEIHRLTDDITESEIDDIYDFGAG